MASALTGDLDATNSGGSAKETRPSRTLSSSSTAPLRQRRSTTSAMTSSGVEAPAERPTTPTSVEPGVVQAAEVAIR